MGKATSQVLGFAIALVLVVVALASAASWSVGGDQGRSGHQPLGAGLPPFEPMWAAGIPGGGRIATPLLITNKGLGPRAPRLVFGTEDGVIHLRDLYSGEVVGPREGVHISNSHVPYSFSGFGGHVGLLETSTEGQHGQIFVVYNDVDQAPSVQQELDAEYADDIAIASIDAETGRLLADVPVPGTDEFRISSPPLLVGEGDNRTIVFSAVDADDWEAEYDRPPDDGGDPTGLLVTPPEDTRVAATVFRVPVTNALSTAARIEGGDTESATVDFVNALAPVGLLYTADLTVPPPTPTPFVTIPTGTPGGQVQTLSTDDFTVTGPTAPRLDPDASGSGNYAFAGGTSVPTTPLGLPPGAPGSKAVRAPALYVASYRKTLDRTIVHRLSPSADGTQLVESARSASFKGRPVPQLAVSGFAGQAGGTAGTVVLATERNLYGLKGGDLSTTWRLEGGDFAAGSTGFTRSAPAISGGTVLISRDNGQPLAVDLKTGRPLGDDRLRVDSGQSGSAIAAPGSPAVANGVIAYASDKGLFAYRNACGNVMRGTGQNEAIEGTKAGDEIFALGGIDTVTSGEGNDCIELGNGEDVADAGPGDDTIKGGEGDDRLMGRAGADLLDGGNGDDVLLLDEGDDVADGGEGEDAVKGSNGNDRIDGGGGNDRLYGNGDDDRLSGDAGRDAIKGGIGNDTLFGGAGGDRLDGGPGNDVIVGGPGADELLGRNGDDRLEASSDGKRDEVICGGGNDTAVVDRRDVARGCERVILKQPAKKKKRKRPARKRKGKR